MRLSTFAPVRPARLRGSTPSWRTSSTAPPRSGTRDRARSTITAAAAHDGALGAEVNGGSWAWRTDTITQPGDTIRFYFRLVGGGNGRLYLGVGSSQSGCFSAVAATNTNNLILQENANYSYNDISKVPVNWAYDMWYQMEIDWQANGTMTVNLYDETGGALIASTPPVQTTATTGGLGPARLRADQPRRHDRRGRGGLDLLHGEGQLARLRPDHLGQRGPGRVEDERLHRRRRAGAQPQARPVLLQGRRSADRAALPVRHAVRRPAEHSAHARDPAPGATRPRRSTAPACSRST